MNQKRIYELRDEAYAAYRKGELDAWYSAQPSMIDGEFNIVPNDLYNLYNVVPEGSTVSCLFVKQTVSSKTISPVNHWRVFIAQVGPHAHGEIREIGGYLRTLGIFKPSRFHEWAIRGDYIFSPDIAQRLGAFLYEDGDALNGHAL